MSGDFASTVALDHVLWAAPDLDAASRAFQALSGAAPAPGGAHPGFGTRNMLVGLADGLYLEIIAPDPAQRLRDNWGAEIAALPEPRLRGFALRSTDLPGLAARAASAGFGVDPPRPMSRALDDGGVLAWTILQLRHPALGPACPFAIDWGTTPHPSTRLSPACRLLALHALHPEPHLVRAAYAAIGPEVQAQVQVQGALRPGMMAVFETPRGEVALLG